MNTINRKCHDVIVSFGKKSSATRQALKLNVLIEEMRVTKT